MEPNALSVRFYKKPHENEFESKLQGRPVSDMRDFVKIETPGNPLNVIDTLVNEDHKARFPTEWAHFCNQSADTPQGVKGTMLSDWPLLTAAQAIEMKHYKFYTVEQVAAASDLQIGSLGMLCGMAPHALRDKAQAYLKRAGDSALSMRFDEEMKKRDQQIADLTDMLTRNMAGAPPKSKGGRPKKTQETASA